MFKAGDQIIAILDAYPSNYTESSKAGYKIAKGTKTHIIDVGKVYNNTQLIQVGTTGMSKFATRQKVPVYYASCFTLYDESFDLQVPVWYTIGNL